MATRAYGRVLIRDQHSIGAVLNHAFGQLLDLMTTQQTPDLALQGGRQFLALRQQLQTHVADPAFFLFDKNPDVF
jgi:hypothetical protein